jgi:hypothetical protein
MNDPRGWVIAAVCLVVALIILTTVTWQVPEDEIYYTYTAFSYSQKFIRENQVRTFPWIHDETEVQYKITNTDLNHGTFLLNFTFDNGSQTKTKTVKVDIMAGEEKAVTINSHLAGISAVTLNVIPPNYANPQHRTIYKTAHVWSYLWDLVFR